MIAAIARYQREGKAALPASALRHIVAARYGQAPGSIRDWAFDDYRDAITYLPITKPRAPQ